MKAKNLLKTRRHLSETVFIDMKVWLVPQKVPGSDHMFKYSLALVSQNVCILRYDNEAGKGDHKHIGATELSSPSMDWMRCKRTFGRMLRNG